MLWEHWMASDSSFEYGKRGATVILVAKDEHGTRARGQHLRRIESFLAPHKHGAKRIERK